MSFVNWVNRTVTPGVVDFDIGPQFSRSHPQMTTTTIA
jgi:hypothetical protein